MIDTGDPAFVFGLKLDGKGGCTAMQSTSEPGWVHVDYSQSSARPLLTSLGVPEAVVDSIVRADTRPRVLQMDEGILLVLRGINLNPGSDPEDMVSIRIWIEGDRVVTVRQRRLLSAQDLRAELEAGKGPKDVSEVVISLISKLINRIADFVESLDSRLDELELQLLGKVEFEQRTLISELRREIATVRRYLAPQREALQTLLGYVRDRISDDEAFELREQSDRMLRYVEDLDLLRERAIVLHEQAMNLVMEEQNQRMYTLSLVAAIFLPITFVSGVFGMNVAGLPGIEYEDAFVIVAVTMAVMTAGIIGYFKMKRWL